MGQCMEYLDISRNRIEVIDAKYIIDFLTRYSKLHVLNASLNSVIRNDFMSSVSDNFSYIKGLNTFLNHSLSYKTQTKSSIIF